MRVLSLLFVFLLLQSNTIAQGVSLQASAGWGPFTPNVSQMNTFSVANIPSDEVVQSAVFEITGGNQALIQSRVAYQAGSSLSFTTNMGGLPYFSRLSVNVTTVTGSGSEEQYALNATIRMGGGGPVITSTTGMRAHIVGQPAQHRYVASGFPPSTTRVALHLLRENGTVIDSVVRTGTAIDTASILYTTSSHKKKTTLSVTYTTPTTTNVGFRTTMVFADSVPLPVVRASLGWGPFQQGVGAVNQFIVKGLGSSCKSIRWWIDAIGRYGMIYGLDSGNATYSPVVDSVLFTSDMGDALQNAALHVVAYYGSPTTDSARTDYSIQILPQTYGPHFFTSFTAPIGLGQAGIDTVSVDSLPVRSAHVRLTLIDQWGGLYNQRNAYPTTNNYVDTARIVFDQSTLPLYTTTVRCEVYSDYEVLPIEYDYYFDVRDTSLPYLFANSWGPFVQTDSSYIVLGAKWMRPIGTSTDTIIGQFSIRDSVADTVIARSVFVPLKGVGYDSTVFWLDTNGTRPLIITGGFPLNTEARFTRYAVRGTDTVQLEFTRHPISMLPQPGILTASQGYGPFTAGRDSMNTFRITNLPPGTREVEFRVTGTHNPAAVDSMLVRPTGTGTLDSAVFTTNMGWLPVNARLHVNVRYDGGPDNGVQLDRFIYTIPDTLAATSTAGFGPLDFSWSFSRRSDTSLYDISGVTPIPTTFTVKRMPAQTLRIAVFTKDDTGALIDSVLVPLTPYQIRFNKDQTLSIPFSFRQFNTSTLTFILYTDGGPGLGITYPLNIKVKNPHLEFDAYKVFTTNASVRDTSALLQGSTNLLNLNLNLGPSPGTKPILTMLAPNHMDSVWYRFRDCNGSVDDSLKGTTAVSGAQTNTINNELYTITPLPITARTVEVEVFSDALHFPRAGFTYVDSVNIVPNPLVDTLYGRLYPSFRATDTTTGKMMQTFTLTHLHNVDSVTNIRWLNPSGVTVGTISNQSPKNDSVRLTYDMNSFGNSPATLRLIGTFVYHRCSDVSKRDILLDTATITTQFAMPPQKNFIWSSLGWGPFRQGKSASTRFLLTFQPSQYIPTAQHDSTDQIVMVLSLHDSNDVQLDSAPVVFTRNYSAAPLPDTCQFRSGYKQLGGLPLGSFVNVAVSWNKRTQAGVVNKLQRTYKFPVTMLPFPPQPLHSDKGWGPFEQSVAAGGYQGVTVMPSIINVQDSVQSTIMKTVLARWIDQSGTQVGSSTYTMNIADRRIVPDPKDPTVTDTIDTWKAAPYDPAQVGWPSIARDARELDMVIDYTFNGLAKPTAHQTQVVSITPRADWINGTQITADSNVNGSIYLTSLIPLPTPGFEKTLPLLGPLPMSTSRADGGSGPLDFKVNAIYTPSNGQFSFNPNSTYNNKGFTWSSNISTSILKGGRAAYVNQGDSHDGFNAEQDFVSDTAGPNREMAIRQLITANLSGNLLAPYTIIKEAMEIIESGLTIVSAAPTIALWVGSEQYYTLNLGTDGTGVLKYAGELPDSEEDAEEYKNKYQTGLANSFSSTLSRGMEVSIAGFFGAGVSIDDQTIIGWGKTYSGGVTSIVEQNWPAATAQRTYFTVDLDLMFGLIHIDLYHGLINASYDPDLMPSFYTFPEIKASIFISEMERSKKFDQVQVAQMSYRPLPPETPYYYARPDVVATSKRLSMVWIEHSRAGQKGSLMIGSLDTLTNSFGATQTLLTNRNGMHDAAMTILNDDGDALLTWNQSRFNASNAPASLSVPELLHAEDVHVGIYDAKSRSLTQDMVVADDMSTAMAGRIDGATKVVSLVNGTSAMVVWPAQSPTSGESDIYGMLLRKTGSVWSMEPVQPIGTTTGYERDLHLVRVADNDVLAVWINERSMDVGQSSLMYARWNGTAWSTPMVILAPGTNRQFNEITVSAYSGGAVLALSTYDRRGQSTPSYKLHELWYSNGQWSSPSVMDESKEDHVIRRLASAVAENGHVVVLAETESGVSPDGSTSHGLMAFVKNQPGSGGSWKVHTNPAALCDTNDQVWHMDASFGPKGYLYLTTQELDTVQANVQSYANGIQIGAARTNTVLRSVVVNDDLSITPRPLGGQPTDVHDENLEHMLRYQAEMYPAYPDPASGSAITIPFVLQMPTHVDLTIVDVTGRIVQVISQGEMAEGQYALNVPIGTLQQGLYRVRLVTSTGQTLTMPFTIVR